MKQRWVIIAEFFSPTDNRWLDDFIEDDGLEFTKIPPVADRGSWHSRNAGITSLGGWVAHFKQARIAYRQGADGIIACFPQLAMCAALLKRFGRAKPKIIAHNFNLGALKPGPRQWLARLCAGQVDVFVVHSPSEVDSYARYLGVARDRLRFLPLQRGKIGIDREEATDAPYVLAMGSAHRDYPLLIRVVDRLGIPTRIVTSAALIAGLPKSPHVQFSSGLTEPECWQLLARARICVTPIANQVTASGQVTFVDAMQLGVPVIATDCPGTDGYIENGRTGILVPAEDEASLATAIQSLWTDPARRAVLSQASRTEAAERFSDPAAARSLAALIHDVG
jgi:glycosyltransferase involved in cell wall biosynthesis